MTAPDSYWKMMWKRFYKHRLGRWALYVVILFCLAGIYAPFLASSRPLFVMYEGEPYFPLFRYLFYKGFFTKRIDIFFNIAILTFPLAVLSLYFFKQSMRKVAITAVALLHLAIFIFLIYFPLSDPAADLTLNKERHQILQEKGPSWQPTWAFELRHMTPYAKLNLLLRYRQSYVQNQSLQRYKEEYQESLKRLAAPITPLPTLWNMHRHHEEQDMARLKKIMENNPQGSPAYQSAEEKLQFIVDKRQWLQEQSQGLKYDIMPLLSPFHWEDDAGGQQALNRFLPWWKLTRINRKDLLAALIFGIRISLTVGIISVAIALLIGIPIGAFAGYYAGKTDIVVSRLLEIWEAMPVFFMLLMIVALLQSKSIFLVTAVIGFFGWTQFSRYIRGEFFKQRNLPYVEACHALGFSSNYTIFKHILPNAIPPVLTLLPFAIMGAITSEAALSFLGLGEEGSCSWGVLMDEGRNVFPAESYLLWPPAILLTLLLVAIALVGDSLRDTLDPKLHR